MHPHKLKQAYESGKNITGILKQESNSNENSQIAIETAYDLQAGSYVKAIENRKSLHHKQKYAGAIAKEILSLTRPASIVEAGSGEGTTFSFVSNQLKIPKIVAHGFDISWSRIAWCRHWMSTNWPERCHLSVASLDHLPYADSSFDIVYTSHTIEPNGGKELPLLQELYRITSRYLILVEPGYELASEGAKERMESLGYFKGLPDNAAFLGMTVIDHKLLGIDANPLNPSAITIIEKNSDATVKMPTFICPNFGDDLLEYSDSFYSPMSLRAYPKILGIPCLRRRDAVIASAYENFRLNHQSYSNEC